MKLKLLMKDRKSVLWGGVGALVYLGLYLFSIGAFRRGYSGVWSFDTAPNWVNMIFRTSAPYVWEPLIRIQTPMFSLVFAPLNLLLGFVLASLVFINIAATINLYRQPKSCRLDAGTKGLWAILPSFLTGFACCVPTFLIPLASVSASLTVHIIWLRQFIIPLSILLLLWGSWYSLRRVGEV